jgi:hypothetical protein
MQIFDMDSQVDGIVYKFSTTTAAADPGTATIRYNNATPASVTALYIDDLAESGVDFGSIFAGLTSGSHIYIEQVNDPSKHQLFSVTSAVDSTGYITVTVTHVDGATLPDDTARLNIRVIANGAVVSGSSFEWGIALGDETTAHTTAVGVISAGSVTLDTGASGSVDGITVNSVEIMSGAEAFDTDLATTAANVAANINANTSIPDYKAAVLSGAVITIYADHPGTGPNGFTVTSSVTTITTTDVDMGTTTAGVDPAVRFRMPCAVTLSEVRLSLGTAPTGAAFQVDINQGISSATTPIPDTILSTKLTVDVGERTSESAATAPVISTTALTDDAEITVDIDVVGSTVAGAGAKLTLIGTRT